MSGAGEVLERLVDQVSVTLSSVPFLVLGAVVLVVVLGLVVRSRLLVRSARTDRVEVAMVPTSSFDPTEEEVLRWSAQLLRTNRVTGRMAPDGARVVRVAFESVGEGRMVQVVSGPGRAESLLRQSGLGEVELVDMAGLAERIGGIDPQDPTGADQAGGGDRHIESQDSVADVDVEVGQVPEPGGGEPVGVSAGEPVGESEPQAVGESWSDAWSRQDGQVDEEAAGAGEIVWTSVGGDR